MRSNTMRSVAILALGVLATGCWLTEGEPVVDPDPNANDLGTIGDAAGEDVAGDTTLPPEDVKPEQDVPATDALPTDAVVALGCVGGDPSQGACPSGWFCATPAGQCGGKGECKALPQACDMMYAPVCGCDGKTYGSSCAAAGAGMSVAHAGECQVEPTICFAGELAKAIMQKPTCQAAEVCVTPEGLCAGQGVCQAMPAGCSKELAPVCGCDGQTYGNACMALAAGTNVKAKGACEPVAKACNPLSMSPIAQCATNEYCALPTGQCGAADGNCAPRPQTCITLYKPVCGCDGKTYGNECEAAGAGVNVAAPFACATTE